MSMCKNCGMENTLKTDVNCWNDSRSSACSIPYPLREQLLDPVFVHNNTLRGTIAKLTDSQIKHLYPHLFERGNQRPINTMDKQTPEQAGGDREECEDAAQDAIWN